MLIDLQAKKIDGGRVERILEQCGIALNKNTVPGDKSAMMPGAPAQCVCVLSSFHVVLELLALLLLPLHSLLMQQQAGLLVQAAGLQHFFSSRRCCLFSQFDHLSPAAAMHSCHAQLPCTACLSPCTACLSPCTAAMHSVLIAMHSVLIAMHSCHAQRAYRRLRRAGGIRLGTPAITTRGFTTYV